jgi:glutamyl/glutaminyl-tRNA synthetase
MEKKESVRRNSSIQENLAMFERLLKGEAEAQKYCMRAKIDMTSVNGTMRDPVLYRYGHGYGYHKQREIRITVTDG